MEPMTLGSPVASPGTPGSMFHNSSNMSHQYLPGYLMGDNVLAGIPSTPSSRMFPTSPVKSRVSGWSFNNSVNNDSALNQSSFINERNSSGPPIKGLFQESTVLSSQTPNRMLNFTSKTPMPSSPDAIHFGSARAGPPNTSSLLTSSSEPQRELNLSADLFQSPSLSEDCGVWVTVFGFPHSSANYILSQFSAYGTILEHRLSPGGNWMHLKFQSPLQAKKALSKNGVVLGDSMMVGVKICTDEKFLKEVCNNTTVLNSSRASELGDCSLNCSKSNIRPLTQAYNTARGENNVILQSPKTPQRTTNIVTRAMEVFGW